MRLLRFMGDLAGPSFGVALLLAPAVAQETTRVSVDSSNAEGNSYSSDPSISADGRFVAFWSLATNLVAGDTNGSGDIFVHDRVTGVTERVSVDSSGTQADSDSFGTNISADGQVVAFWSYANNLVAGDTNGSLDVFVHDRVTGITNRVSVDSSGAEADADCGVASISAGGQVVAFESYASNLVAGDVNGLSDVFVHDRVTGLTERVSVDSSGAEGDFNSFDASVSASGLIVAFGSYSKNLVAGDTNNRSDVFVHDRVMGTTERVSLDSSGAEGDGNSDTPSVSADGQFVAFQSLATNLVAGDANFAEDVFIHDRVSGLTERSSVNSSGAEADASCWEPSISADGSIVAFWSSATNLVAGDANRINDVFVHERCMIDAAWSNYGAGFPGTNGVPGFTSRNDPVLGAQITLDLDDSSGTSTAGLLFVGFLRAQIHSGWGGDLLVLPALTLPVTIPSGGAAFTGGIPVDPALCSFTLDLQAIEFDPGAAKKVSFTPGLELLLGH